MVSHANLHPYIEAQTIAVTAEGYMEDVMFGGLPHDLDDELRFDDGAVGATREAAFTLKNHSARHWRFEWPAVEGFKIVPAVGHLHAGAEKPVVLTFTPEAAVKHDPLELPLSLVPITYDAPAPAEGEDAAAAAPAEPEPVHWDDSMTTTREEEVPVEELPEDAPKVRRCRLTPPSG